MTVSAAEKIENFFKKYPKCMFRRGQLLIAPKKFSDGIYCITTGIVRCYALSKQKIGLTINVYKPISFFPMFLVMNGKPDRYFYEALTDVESYCAPVADVRKFIESEHDVSFDLLKRIYKGLDGYFLRMESLLSGNAHARVATTLSIHAQRFGKTTDQHEIVVRLTHRQIASQSGLTRETVTREINTLQEKSIVRYQGHTLIIPDLQTLERTG